MTTTPLTNTPPAVISRLLGHVTGHATERPDEPAVITADGSLTWAGLAGSVGTATRALRAHGIARGTVVALATGRDRYAVTALLSVWALGATAVLLDERHPAAHLSGVIANSDAEWIIAAELTPEVLGNGVPVLTTSDLLEEPAGVDGVVEPRPDSPDDVAYVIHTSGSSGRPKGVDVSFGNLEAFVDAIETLGMPRGGHGINAVSPAFDGWLWCTLLYLVFGNALGIVDLARSTADGPAAAIAALTPRVVCLTPSLLAACEGGVDSAEAIVVAGEPCPPDLAKRHGTGRRLLNVYGPTEATIAATWADSARGDDLTTIGTSIPGYAVHVLDPEGRPTPDGEQGELYIGGPGVALGYRHEPELTARHFVTDPLRGRIYGTGDLVRRRTDGQLEFCGRVDTQVKVRGFRVELTEIERRAVGPGVAQAVAYLLPGGRTIGLAVVPAEGYPGDGELRDLLAARLPAHQVPSGIRRLESLPLTPNGKTDRAALATAHAAADGTGHHPPEATDTLLSAVMKVWNTALEQPVTDVDADFFASGGHSLLAAEMITALRQATGVSLSMRELLSNPTIRACADLVRARLNEPRAAS
ncbi:amino acid adenylation domain-containing protein [Streptomyces puniciscabiei]|uniref:Amino acid adenylation domain-containing protein n=1 Tax=Streptomyces puniciscabiei TaxID=164348 RepID=A0A542UCH4_9ACTN|nr:non-ribosomal peptide synthetase [Streptomyces puniciscabiei]TQK96789.1 amino acid adenylation domain-containing protein [Streptomyces puniciscabiei]